MNYNKEIMELKNTVENNKKEYTETNAKIELLLQTLEKKYNCANIDEASEYLEELKESKNELLSKLESGIIELKNDLGINTNRDQ